MTTIVWDGVTIASDSRLTEGNYIVSDNFTKIAKCSKLLKLHGQHVIAYAIAGNFDVLPYVESWIEKGCPINELVKEGSTLDGDLIIILENSVLLSELYTGGRLVPIKGCVALGSGALPARSGLLLGLSAKECVELAMKIDTMSGGAVQEIVCRSDSAEKKL